MSQPIVAELMFAEPSVIANVADERGRELAAMLFDEGDDRRGALAYKFLDTVLDHHEEPDRLADIDEDDIEAVLLGRSLVATIKYRNLMLNQRPISCGETR